MADKQYSGNGWKGFVPSTQARKVINALADGFEFRSIVGVARTSTLTIEQVESVMNKLADINAVSTVTRKLDGATLYRLNPILE